MRKTLTIALLTFAPLVGSADCLDPFKQPITRTESGVVVNSVIDGTSLCIDRATRWCKECEPGYRHVCMDGKWEPNKRLECNQRTLNKSMPTVAQPAPGENSPVNATENVKSVKFSEAAVALHTATIACGGGAPLDAIDRSLTQRKDPLWSGPSPTTAADILKLSNAHHDKDLQNLKICVEAATGNCEYLEDSVGRSACLVQELERLQ